MAVTSSYDVSDYIPASLIKEWVWCPTSAWYMTLSLPEPLPPHVTDPEEWDTSYLITELLTYYGTEPKYVTVKPRLKSLRLGIAGSPDILIVYEDFAVVVEVKTTSSWSLEDHSKLQVAAYALMASEMLGLSDVRAVIATRMGYEEVNWRSLIPRLLSVLKDIKEMLQTEEVTRPLRIDSRCRACPYRRHCFYRGDTYD